jgi:glycosyltransferase involved in cell wall biosynthesis/predicted O-methyltransferase YrrM
MSAILQASTPHTVLVISHDVIGRRMAGPGIRYFYLAQVLSREFQVILAIPGPVSEMAGNGSNENLRIVEYQMGDWSTLQGLVDQADVCLVNGYFVSFHLEFYDLEIPIIVDGYDPLWAEWIEAAAPEELAANWQLEIKRLLHQYLIGDFFIVASERQRDWWLGLLENAGRINPWTYAEDSSLRKLIDVTPFGAPQNKAEHSRFVIRGKWDGIGKNDKIILWGGGLWLWLDPLTAIRAMQIVLASRQDVRLVFPGALRPTPGSLRPPTHLEEARQEAQRLGLLDKAVFFGDWIDFQDWPNVLMESDLALTLHAKDTLESHLAFRTRILDCIWTGLPIIATRGDVTSQMIVEYGLGTVVDAQDVAGLANAILEILKTPAEIFRQRAVTAQARLSWEEVARPIIQFCRSPRCAPDKPFIGKRIGHPTYLELTALVEENARLHAFLGQATQQNQRLLSELNHANLIRHQFEKNMEEQIRQMEQENQDLRTLVTAYQNRRVVRFADRLSGLCSKTTAPQQPTTSASIESPAPPTEVDAELVYYNAAQFPTEFNQQTLEAISSAPAWMTLSERLMLFSLVLSLRPNVYLEIGSYQGGSAQIVCAAMDAAHSHGKIVCVDPQPQISSETLHQIEHRAVIIEGYSPDILPQARQAAQADFDFALIDGDHSYPAALIDGEAVLQYCNQGAYLLFHDCFNPDVQRAIDELVSKHSTFLVDLGPVTREYTLQDGHNIRWGGLRLLRVRP